jgi:hypothetical protein
MPGTTVALVERRGVEAVQPFHPVGERRLAALDHEVVVVAHQAVGVAAPAEAVEHPFEEEDEEDPVVVVQEDRAPVDATRRDVPDPVAEGRAQRSRHPSTVNRRPDSCLVPRAARPTTIVSPAAVARACP